jgi:hypothetical protein
VDGAQDLLIERLLRVIDEGRRTATYKLALLSALIDSVAVLPGRTDVPTRMIAEQVLARYYPQTRIFVAADGIARELRQISAKESPVLRHVLRLRLAGDSARCRSIDEVRGRLPDLHAEVLDEVESTFVRYPIPLLQVVGRAVVPFLYEVEWPEGTSISSLRRTHLDRVRLLPGVADRLVVLGPMLRPLIELHWSRDVARWTGVALEDDALQAHLFGRERVGFPRRLVAGLRELQHDCCFYCGRDLTTPRHIDHFLAWSRWPNDAIENLVLADGCNLAKSNHLASRDHTDRWRRHVNMHSSALREIALAAGWHSEPERSIALVRTTYAHVAAGTPLWRHATEFDLAIGPIEI